MKTLIKGETRGGGDYGWLKTRYSFSFANYYDPGRMGFGALRVINDDWIAPQSGFGEHSHNDMEIITIPFMGTLSHQDSTGGKGIIGAGEVQVMSAGTGVTHSEYNHHDEAVELFQIWIEPKSYGITPRYDQKHFDFSKRTNTLVVLVSGDGQDDSLCIHQEARILRGQYENATEEVYQIPENQGVYIILRKGEVALDDHTLGSGDAISIVDEESFTMKIASGTDVVIIEVPLQKKSL